MNEQMLFQRMDYMKNPNLVFEENTLYEMDPNCVRQREQDNVTAIRSSLQRDYVRHQETEAKEPLSKTVLDEEEIDETMLSPKQDELVTNMFFQEDVKKRNKKPQILWVLLLVLLVVRS